MRKDRIGVMKPCGIFDENGAVTPLLEIWVWLSFQKPQKQETRPTLPTRVSCRCVYDS